MSSGNSSLGIIVGIDDSPAAQVAVRWAARDAELRKIPLTLVHAVSPEVATWLEVPLPPGVLRWQQDHGRHLIDDALKVVEQASLRAGPPTVHSRNRSGGSRSHIGRHVQRRSADGRGLSRKWAVAGPAARFGQFRPAPPRALSGRDHPRRRFGDAASPASAGASWR